MSAVVCHRHRLAAFRCFPEWDEIPPEKVKWVREGVYDETPRDHLREDLRRVAQAIADAEAGMIADPYDAPST